MLTNAVIAPGAELRERWCPCGDLDPMRVIGTEMFIEYTKEALALLATTAHFAFVRRYIGIIQQHSQTGMGAYYRPPTCFCAGPTWGAGAIWYASAILHEGYHSKLYHDDRRRCLFVWYTPRRA